MSAPASAAKSSASKRRLDEVAISDNGNGTERGQKGGRTTVSEEARAVEAAKKVVAEGLSSREREPARIPNPLENAARKRTTVLPIVERMGKELVRPLKRR